MTRPRCRRPSGTHPRPVPGPVRHRHRGADVPGRGPLPAVPPRPRRWLPAALAAGLSPHSMRQACLRTLNLAPGPACATCRTPWDTPPRAPPGGTTAAAATWTAPPLSARRVHQPRPLSNPVGQSLSARQRGGGDHRGGPGPEQITAAGSREPRPPADDVVPRCSADGPTWR